MVEARGAAREQTVVKNVWHASCLVLLDGGAMITRELLAKLRLENTSLLARVDQLRDRAESEGTSALSHEIGMLRGDLRDYIGLVDAVVDALMPDAPRTRKAG
jgi:hypothetical protein